MKYCTKCGHNLIDNARFCNACGAPAQVSAAENVNPENPYANVAANTAPNAYAQPAPTYTNEPKTEEQLRAEEQAVLDKYSLGLKHERLCWKIFGIVFTILSAFYILFGLFFGAVTATLAIEGGEFAAVAPAMLMYIFAGLMYLPIAIINFSMKKKLENYREKLYTDCTDGINHYSVGSIVFAAFFNNIALIFIIIYFIQTKSDKSVIDRIKANQDSYNSQQ